MTATVGLALAALLAGCGGGEPTAAAHMSLTTSGLMPSDVGSVEVLVLGGPRATCDRALGPVSPLDDPDLNIVRHALFPADGSAKHLANIPAGQSLAFYVEAFKAADGTRPRIGRGCSVSTLVAGTTTGVSITITASN